MPGIEVGLVTTNLDAMTAFYEGFLELEPQGEIAFSDAGGGGSQRRYTLGNSVLKLVTYTTAPAPAVPGGGRAQAGLRYFTIGVNGLRAVAEAFEASPYEIVEPVTEFAPVPGMGFMFVADPDGNHLELFGTL
ncbi:VOC family protein [Mycolicibacterium psychrotolerans]|nr:VOC family protein [Mycolicibacterium psychrotolerans]